MELAGIILDGIILTLLGTTIFFAGRLSLSLKTFREGRAEFERVLKDLDKSITQAQDAVGRLQQTSDDTGHALQMKINESKALSDELQLVNEAAANLADRIEALATKNRKIADQIEHAVGYTGRPLELETVTSDLPKAKTKPSKPDPKGFEIHDRDADDDDSDDVFSQDHELMSKAEIELANAIKKKKK